MSFNNKKKSQWIIVITNLVMAGITIWLFIIIDFTTEQGIVVYSTTATIIASLFGLTTAFYLFSIQNKNNSGKNSEKLFNFFLVIAVSGSITLSLSIISIFLNWVPSPIWMNIFLWILIMSLVGFFVEMTLIFCFAIEILHSK